MMSKKIIIVFLGQFLLVAAGCNFDSPTSAQLNNQPKTNSQTNVETNQKTTESDLISNQYPAVLFGIFHLKDARKNLQTTAEITLRGEDVRATVNRGFDVNLPPIGANVKMDIMNCAGYLASAKVTYKGLQITDVWTAELIPETKVADLEQKLLQCAENPNDEMTRKYPANFVYFIAPIEEKRKQITNVKNPDWKAIIPTIPHEWRKIANLPPSPTKKQLNSCVSDWLDSDGDGEIDILALCAVNEESVLESGGVWQYKRILRKIDGNWREIWQTTDTKD